MNNSIKDKLASEAASIREYISFNGKDEKDESEQAILQSVGVAALWHRIREDNFAYLADEVGMGKTRQAMAVIATQFLIKPDSRVVIICPGKPLQTQWKSEWDIFVSRCLRISDGVLKSALDNRVNQSLALHDRLSEFASSLLLDDERLHLLRYSSFSRPIGFNGKKTKEQITSFYKEKLKEIGIADINQKEQEIIDTKGLTIDDCIKTVTARLNTQYAKRIQVLFNEDTRPIDLIVCDEAQYLRHIGNARNTHLNYSLGAKSNKWLFLSATPLHSGQTDIQSLEHYICTHERDKETKVCSNALCVNISAAMNGTLKDKRRMDVIDILDEFLVRRPRLYSDGSRESYDKVSYRNYTTDAAVATNDAFSSMVTALVQKRLVSSLGGRNNRFRQGECSSFESLASSVKRIINTNSDGISYEKPEIESLDSSATSDVPPDRGDIDQLNKSIRKVLVDNKVTTEQDVKLKNIPHPKLYHVVDQLVDNCLKDAPNHKTLVFVRRLATVEELIDLLKQRFQKVIDKRIIEWPHVIKNMQSITNKKDLFLNADDFWNINEPDEPLEFSPSDMEDDETDIKEPDLPYFKAIRKSETKQESNGMLYSFLTRLLQPESSDGKRKSLFASLVPNEKEQENHWQSPLWKKLLDAIFGEGEVPPSTLTQADNAKNILLLKRCILQSMRRSDFLVDLYILNGFVNIEGETTLSEKLIYMFSKAKAGQLKSVSSELHDYLNNWRQRLKNWCLHFELISSKCFNSKKTDIDAVFRGMAPVVGRSGDIANKYAVSQFKMPCYPNILICTDVLKEGVDMHLFCDEVIHYGVAWTSGDLEQRTGRVDRVNSLINRRINKHVNGRDSAPKLNVGFPYLAGTLDQYQVKRVVKEKMLSDLRMDFGKRENEIKEISIDDVFNNKAETKMLPNALKIREFIPSTLLLDNGLLKDYDFSYYQCSTHKKMANYKIQAKSNIKIKDIYPLPVLVVTYESPKENTSYSSTLSDNLKTKWEYKKKEDKGNFKWIGNFEVVVPLALSNQEMDDIASVLENTTHQLEPTPVLSLSEAKGFEFNKSLNTLAMTIKHKAPFEQTADRKQTVMLERIGDLLLVRSPIVSTKQLGLVGKELAIWIGKQNNKRKWGYLNDHDEVIWYCCLMAYPEKLGITFEKLINHISETADRLQQLYTASDNENWNYKANNTFNLAKEGATSNKQIIQKIKENNSIRTRIGRWYIDVFKEIIIRMAQDIETPEDRLSDVLYNIGKSDKLLREGIFNLYMPEKPALRFNLQSFLDMSNYTMEPSMIWQLGISTATKGRSPKLDMDDYDGLPHIEKNEWWSEIETDNQIKIYTYQDDEKKMRWFVLYHPASMLDGRIKLFIDAWVRVFQRMKGNTSKFMKQACANDFKDFSISSDDCLNKRN